MFGSNPKSTPAAPASTNPLPSFTEAAKPPKNVLSQGVSIIGDVTFGDELVIDGEVEGTITSNGTLIIGQNAQIQGEISASSVTVHGTVEGNIMATERCALEAGATLRGDVEAPRLAVDESAKFQGRANIPGQRTQGRKH